MSAIANKEWLDASRLAADTLRQKLIDRIRNSDESIENKQFLEEEMHYLIDKLSMQMRGEI